MNEDLIYHVCDGAAWRAARTAGVYAGSADDVRDGYMHFSTRSQVRASTARHRAGQAGLVLLVVDVKKLGPALRWERSRGDQLFPHLFGPLSLDAVLETIELPLGPGGRHNFPAGYPV